MGIEDDAADGGLDELALHLHRLGVRHILVVVGGGEVDDFTGVPQANRRKQLDFASFQRKDDVLGGTENAAFTLGAGLALGQVDRKSTRLNSSHRCISYAVFCLKKKKQIK